MNTNVRKPTSYQVLRNKFPENECVLICEVFDASGFSRSRSLDYMLVNLWQSRGLSVTGIEEKSNRSDWLRELKNPQKQENHFKYCDYFYLLTDKEGVAKLEEIPETWGWYHINDKSILKTMKQAPKLPSQPVERSLLCAMLRRAADKTGFTHKDVIEERVAEKIKAGLSGHNAMLERKAAEHDELLRKIKLFENETGLDIQYNWDDRLKNIGMTVNMILEKGLIGYVDQLERAVPQLKNLEDHIKKKIEVIREYVSKTNPQYEKD
jgi:hypothetical protein